MSLVTLAQIKNELKAQTTTAAQDADLISLARYVTARWRDIVGMDFEPYYKTRKIMASRTNIFEYGQVLRLPEPLLELSTIVSDGVTLTYNTDVFAEPIDASPIGKLRLNDTDCLTWYPYQSASFLNGIVVTGTWGYRRDYTAQGWINSGDANVAAITTTTATTFTVTSATGLDGLYRTPRFSEGNLLKLDSEIMEIDNVSTNTLTVRRGQRGTTAATHVISTTIYTWNPEPDIVNTLARAASYKFASKGAFEEANITDVGMVTYPSDMPRQVYAVAQRYANGY